MKKSKKLCLKTWPKKNLKLNKRSLMKRENFKKKKEMPRIRLRKKLKLLRRRLMTRPKLLLPKTQLQVKMLTPRKMKRRKTTRKRILLNQLKELLHQRRNQSLSIDQKLHQLKPRKIKLSQRKLLKFLRKHQKLKKKNHKRKRNLRMNWLVLRKQQRIKQMLTGDYLEQKHKLLKLRKSLKFQLKKNLQPKKKLNQRKQLKFLRKHQKPRKKLQRKRSQNKRSRRKPVIKIHPRKIKKNLKNLTHPLPNQQVPRVQNLSNLLHQMLRSKPFKNS
jgi:hypothetical protein